MNENELLSKETCILTTAFKMMNRLSEQVNKMVYGFFEYSDDFSLTENTC